MSHILCLYPPLSIVAFLEGKYHQHAVNVSPHPANAPLLPRPKLGRDEVNYRHPLSMQSLSQPEIELRKINHHRHIWPAPARHRNHAEELAIDSRDVLDHFSDPHHRDPLRVDHNFTSGRAHPLAAYPKEFCLIS